MAEKDLIGEMAQSIIDGNKDEAEALAKKAVEWPIV
jgi:hypothetical protein